MAAELAAGAPYAVGHAKRVVYSGMDMPLEQAGELEGVTITGAMATSDGGREHTWGELIERVAKLAGALRGLGIVEGERRMDAAVVELDALPDAIRA